MTPRYHFELRRTNFHAQTDHRTAESPYDASSEVISRHCTLQAATRALLRYTAHTDCTCGCVVIVGTTEHTQLEAAAIEAARGDLPWVFELANQFDLARAKRS